MSEQIRRILITTAIFAAAALICEQWLEGHDGRALFALAGGQPADVDTKAAAPKSPHLTDEDVPSLARESNESAKLAAAVLPSIVRVNIGAKGVVPQRDIFGFSRGRAEGMIPTGLGSGVIVSKDGLVITNYHVIQGGQQVRVNTHDHKTYDTTVVGVDRDLDIAVIKISDPGPFSALTFADSDKVRVGELAFAVGSPFGLEFTVSRGIVSATQRRLRDTGNDYIQTDAAINPGNSGGPLINHRGEVIGINASYYHQADNNGTENNGAEKIQTWQGVSFAIPANDAKEALNAITGKVARTPGYLGLEVDIARIQRGLHFAYGALVTRVTPGSPAENAGLQKNDIIAQFDGRNFFGGEDILRRIRIAKPGQSIKMTVLRKDQEITLTAVVGKKPEVK